MSQSKSLSRRDFLRITSVGVVSLYAGVHSKSLFAQGDVPDVEINLNVTPGEVTILPGTPTSVWRYQGNVVNGDAGVLQVLPNSYLGPIFRLRRGQRVRVNFTNDLLQTTVIHWHGLRLPEEMDAHPRYAIEPGQTYIYDFEVLNRAGTYWYHAHPDMLTGEQVYRGLAGLFIVSDDEETAARLPEGDYDLPLVIQDRTFDGDNQLVYIPDNMRADTMGFLGDRVLVNGQPDFSLSVETRAYRLRFLNGSNFRVYKLGWENGTPLTVIGTDGGLLETPVQRDYVVIAPGERVDLWIDFGSYDTGTELQLQSLAFSGIEVSGAMGGMDMGGMDMGGSVLEHGAEFTVMRVNVVGESAAESLPIPAQLSTFSRYQLADAINSDAPRRFTLTRQGQNWQINGRSFEMESVADDEIVQLNTLEVWELESLLEGADRMAHPMHIHGVQFQVLERAVAAETTEGWESVRAGYVDEGWKDTILIMPGERVRLLVKFEDFTGLFVYHCHNLEHEDLGMMRNYRVEA